VHGYMGFIYDVCDETFVLKWTLFFCIAVAVLVRVLVSLLKCPTVVGFNYVSHENKFWIQNYKNEIT
jgi:hypothetical protein